MRIPTSLPYRGTLIWLTPEQGGRTSGPPPTPDDHDYATTAYIPPSTSQDGLASFVVRATDRTAWRTSACGGWLFAAAPKSPPVTKGTVIVITEGPRNVAYFHVEHLDVTEL